MEPILYFAYGSNMDTATLGGRRGITLGLAGAGRVEGWRLALDKPSLLGNGEAVATIVEDPQAEVWGVLYEISPQDFEHLSLTEGVLIDHYRCVEVVVLVGSPWSDEEQPKPAISLASDLRDASLRPSRRYLNLLLRGAAEHGLPAAWRRMLEDVPADEESAESLALRSIVDAVLKKPAST